MSPWAVMMGMILILTPLICWVFTLNVKHTRTPLANIGQMIHDQRYYLHALGYLVIIKWKSITDDLNEPIKIVTGHWTELVHTIEGDTVLHLQNAFAHPALTAFLNFHYLFIYLFLIYVTTVFYAYVGERDLTDKVTLNYLLIYALAVPYYLFLNVEVTSSWIPGMEALLYHDSMYSTFYASHDPLDNAVPSLHIAIPFGIILLNVLHVRQQGRRIREWEHRRYHYFVVGNTIVFAFTILYLGIHWITDIPLGMLIGGTGALFIHYLQPRLRNDHGGWFRGVSRAKVSRHVIVEGSIALLLAALLAGATAHQVDTADDRVDYRLGPGDTVHDIVQRFDVGEQVEVGIVNLDSDSPVHVALRIAEEAEPAFEAGYVNWEAIEASGSVITVEPGARVDLIVDQPKVWWLVLMHVDDDANSSPVELQVTNHYGEAPMNKAVLLSLPSLWMTGFVLHRIARNRLNGLHWLDPTPSHAWEEA
jgi:hypothetical protein